MSEGYMEELNWTLGEGRGGMGGAGRNGLTSHLNSYFRGWILNRNLGLQTQDVSSAYFSWML